MKRGINFFLMDFIKNGNLYGIYKKIGNFVCRFYVCLVCGCKIKFYC